MSESGKKQPQGKKGDFHRSPKYQQMAAQRAAEQQQSQQPAEQQQGQEAEEGNYSGC